MITIDVGNIEVTQTTGEELEIRVQSVKGGYAIIKMRSETAEQLRDALTEWLEAQ